MWRADAAQTIKPVAWMSPLPGCQKGILPSDAASM
jgi:hypothetical protein